MSLSKSEKQICSELDRFLVSNEKHSVSTVINTIFPASLYSKHKASEVFDRYEKDIMPKLKNHPDTKWGTYFGRMTKRIGEPGKEFRPLEYLIAKLRRQAEGSAPKRAVYEMNLVEPFVDIPIYDASADKHYHMGGPCLSHLSFKLKSDKSLILTAIYRHHYYIERALGNFYGLAFLLDFVAKEAKVRSAELVCHSTMAILDTEGVRKTDVTNMLDACEKIRESAPNGAVIR
jgi:hypothetical protein